MKPVSPRVVAVLTLMLAAAPARAAPADAVLGRWATPSKHGVVEITRCGASICGRLVNGDDIRANADARDVNNRNVAQRTRRLKDLTIIQGFRPDGDKWTDGSVYNPEDGGTYHGTITIDGADALRLKGCIFWPLCKTQTWTPLR